MMDVVTENPKLDLASSYEARGPEDKLSTQKISVSDRINGFQYTTDKSDNFVVDIESFPHGGNSKEINPNSKITRSLSRKGSQRGDKKIITPNCSNSNSSSSLNDRDSYVATSSSPRGKTIFLEKNGNSLDQHGIYIVATTVEGSSTLEKPTAIAAGSIDQASNQQVHHQITITTGNIAAAMESRFSLRRSSSRRSPPSWLLDPKRILMFFATLSSMGTILLIYFTLSISKMNADENAFD